MGRTCTIAGFNMEVISLNNKVITAPSGKWIFQPPTSVTIGWRTYNTALMPDGRVWTTVNLDYAWQGLHIQTSSSDTYENIQAAYYNFDETTYGWDGSRDGLLYTWYAVRYLDNNRDTLLPPGWHVPSVSEFENLISSLGGQEVAGLHLKSTTGWDNDGNGDGSTDFDARPSGFRSYATGMPFSGYGNVCLLWTRNNGTFFPYQYRMHYYGDMIYQDHNPENQHCSLRLIMDAV